MAVDKFPDFGCRFFFDAAADLFVAFFEIPCLLGNPVRVFFQNFPKHPGNLRYIGF